MRGKRRHLPSSCDTAYAVIISRRKYAMIDTSHAHRQHISWYSRMKISARSATLIDNAYKEHDQLPRSFAGPARAQLTSRSMQPIKTFLIAATCMIFVAAGPHHKKRSMCKSKTAPTPNPTQSFSGEQKPTSPSTSAVSPFPTESPPPLLFSQSTRHESSENATTVTPGGGGPKGGGKRSAGCGKSPTRKTGITTVGNHPVTLDLPDGYDPNKPYRLVICYPWIGGDMHPVATGDSIKKDAWAFYGLKPLNAAQKDMIFIAPQGQLLPDSVTVAMLNDMEENFCIDTTRIFATGFSMGAMTSFQLACTQADKFRAIVALSGNGVSSNCQTPVAIMASNGLRDSLMDWQHVVSTMENFATKLNGCDPSSGGVKPPPKGSMTHTFYQWKNCKYPTQILLFDAGHSADPGDNKQGDDVLKGYNPPTSYAFIDQF